ncbi:MAG: ribokinase [Actinomycetota bacterium]
MFDVCVVGSANLDLVATVDRLPGAGETVPGTSYREYPGGKGLNQAVAAARNGASCAFAGTLGLDDAATLLQRVMQEDGIDTEHVERVSLPTGRALIFVAPSGENSIVVVGGANLATRAVDTPPAKVVLAQLEVPVDAVERAFRAARERGAITVLNPAPAKDVPDSLLALCDVLTPNEHEVELLGGVARLRSLGATAVIVTRGEQGADLHHGDEVVRVPAFPVEAIDATGAGDTFSGALCARLASDDTFSAAVRFASAAAAISTTRRGAVPSIPTADEVLDLLG